MSFALPSLMPRRSLLCCALAVASLFICSSASAQQPPEGQTPAASTPAASAPAAAGPADPASPAPPAPPPAPPRRAPADPASAAQPDTPPATTTHKELDQTLINLGTTLPLKRYGSYFRITHRFARDLGRGTVGELAEDAFSLDSGAIIGLEYRFGITSSVQAGINRSILGKRVVGVGRWDALKQNHARPFALSATVSVEGQNNLRVDPQPGVAATISHVHGPFALYASPTFIKDAHTPTLRVLHEGHEHGGEGEAGEDPDAHEDQNDTAYIGLGVRAHIRPSVSAVFEISPRVYGYRPGDALWGVAIEKLTHGHVLQLNLTNSFNTTPGQVARGGTPNVTYLGFNLSRKF